MRTILALSLLLASIVFAFGGTYIIDAHNPLVGYSMLILSFSCALNCIVVAWVPARREPRP